MSTWTHSSGLAPIRSIFNVRWYLEFPVPFQRVEPAAPQLTYQLFSQTLRKPSQGYWNNDLCDVKTLFSHGNDRELSYQRVVEVPRKLGSLSSYGILK